MTKPKPKLNKNTKLIFILAFFSSILAIAFFYLYQQKNSSDEIQGNLIKVTDEKINVENELESIRVEFEEFKKTDQVKRNDELQEKVEAIENTYDEAVDVYENLLKLKDKTETDEELDELLTTALVYLSDQNYASASSTLEDLSGKISEEEKKLAAAVPSVSTNVSTSSTPPGSGYARQNVSTDVGTFLVSMIAGDLGSTRVIVDTASDGDCGNECPVLSLGEYVSRNGAYAGVNGSYFCPASYPSCAGKTNTFDLLVMNHKKTYFNSGNNVYSNNPAVIFGEGYIRFVSAASQWGRDTSPSGVLSNYPLLVFNSNVAFGGDDDPKKGSRAGRSFVANKGNTVYIGVVHSSTVVEAAHALKALGMENGMNLDSGGSTALWSGGYRVGPGRNIPNAILFVRK